jgi:hypothetical protein
MKPFHLPLPSPRATPRRSAAGSVGAQLAAVLMAVVVVHHAPEHGTPKPPAAAADAPQPGSLVSR